MQQKKMIWLAVLGVAAKVLYDHFRAYGESRWLLVAAVCVLLAAAAIESSETGCSATQCSLARQREVQGPIAASAEEAMCEASQRVTWRISYMLAFAVFTVLNIQRIAPRENLTMLIATWAIAQGAFSYLSFHRLGIWCPNRKRF